MNVIKGTPSGSEDEQKEKGETRANNYDAPFIVPTPTYFNILC
jgi:hypothetical protein